MHTRRSFVSGLAATGVAAAAFHRNAVAVMNEAARAAGQASPLDLARDEDYWSHIQRAFDTDRTLINFNNGGVCPSPTHVLEKMIRDLRWTNESPVQHMWRVLEPQVETVRRELARDFGCDAEEIAINRNTSEGMENLALGLDLERGDEVIVTDHNYPRMLNTWKQRAKREGIVVKTVTFPVPLPSPQTFVDAIAAAITPRTRAIEYPHITNLSGQILPVREVVQVARPKNIQVFVDGAHAFAHFPFKRDDLDCDYYATSLHKWLLAPIGTGFLYVRKEKIKDIWPLMAANEGQEGDIRKFEEIGTHPAANHNAIAVALAFHQGIGVERKAARLRYLRDRWAQPLKNHPKVKIRTDLEDPSASCGICLVQVEGLDPGKITAHLFEKYRIVTTTIAHDAFKGVRVTPNIYATLDEVDRFAEALDKVIANGLG